jgi:hypothetical protein
MGFGIGKDKTYRPFAERSYYINFMKETEGKKKSTWNTPAGLRITGDLRRGTMLSIRNTKFSNDLVNGIVFYKDDQGVTLIKLRKDL